MSSTLRVPANQIDVWSWSPVLFVVVVVVLLLLVLRGFGSVGQCDRLSSSIETSFKFPIYFCL